LSDTIVIGFGNTLREDDGAGVRAAELIRDAFPEIDVVTLHELQPELAEKISHYRTVVFIDARAGGNALSCAGVCADASWKPDDSHSQSPACLLAASSALYNHCPDLAVMVGIPAFQFGFRETLSPTTALMLPECAALVGRLLRRARMDDVVSAHC